MHMFKPLALMAALLAGAPAFASDAHATGKTFKDCKDCPQMVVLPAGSFTMGVPDDEVGRQPDEGPLHTVTFAKPFAISQFQVQAKQLQAWQRKKWIKLERGGLVICAPDALRDIVASSGL